MAQTRFTGPVVSDNGFEGQFTATQVQLESTNGNKITLDAPAGLAANYSFLLPGSGGSNGQVLTTNGSGTTSWTTNGAGTVTSVGGTGTVNGLTLTGTVTSSGSLTLGGTLDLSAPPAIGGGTPAGATFTTLTANTSLTMADAANIILNTTTGTKIGTATGQKLAFYNSTPVIQPAGTGVTSGFTAGVGTAAKDDSTFTGGTGSAAYTIGDIVKALKDLGLLAA